MPKPKDYIGEGWGGRKYGAYKWFEIQDPVEYYQEFDKPKIIYPDISTTGNFTLDEEGIYIDMTAFSIAGDNKYLLGILNSKLCKYYFSKISSEIRGGFLRWKRQYIEKIPIKKINKENQHMHDEIIKFVDNILALNKEKQQTTLPEKLEQLQHRIHYTDDKINKQVYELYGLTDEEINIIEGKT